MICIDDRTAKHLALINQARSSRGLYPLRISESLHRAAGAKAGILATADHFDHAEPGGRRPAQLATDYGYPEQQWIGENILWGTGDPTDAFQVWWDSPPHRENILHPSYREIGIALNVEPVWDYGGDVFAVGVQLFGSANTTPVYSCDSVPATPPTKPGKVPPTIETPRDDKLHRKPVSGRERALNRLIRKILRKVKK